MIAKMHNWEVILPYQHACWISWKALPVVIEKNFLSFRVDWKESKNIEQQGLFYAQTKVEEWFSWIYIIPFLILLLQVCFTYLLVAVKMA